MIKERHSTEQITQDIWLSQEYLLEYQAVGYLSLNITGNECQSYTDMEDNSGFGCSIQETQT